MRSRRLRSIVLAGCALAGFAANSSAQFVASWTSAASGTWTNAANWSTNPVFPNNNNPAVGDTYDAVIDAVGPAYTVTLDAPITLNSLHLNSPSATLLQNGGTLTLLNGGTISAGIYRLGQGAYVGGPGALTITGGGLDVLGSSSATFATNINNQGITTLRGAATLNNANFNNSGILLVASNTSTALFGAGTSRLINTGTILSSLGTAAFNQLALPFVNSGTIVSNSGRLQLNAGTHLAGSTITGPGSITLNGTHFLDGTLTVAGRDVSTFATFTGPGDLEITGRFVWPGGTFSGSGAVNVRPRGQISDVLTAFSTRRLMRVINNEGTISIVAGTLEFDGGTLNNTATGHIDILRPLSIANVGSSSANRIINAGTIQFSPGNSSVSLNPPVTNSGTVLINSGTVLFFGSLAHSGSSYFGGPGVVELVGTNHTSTGRLTLAARETRLGSLTNNGTLEIATTLASAGTISGSGVTNIAPNASITGGFTLGQTMNNAGLIHPGTTGSISFNNGTLNNLSGGMIVLNSGVVGTGTNIGSALNNTGTITITGISGGGFVSLSTMTNSGTIHAAGSLSAGNGTITHNTGSTFAGPGSFSVGSAVHRVNGTLTLAGENMALNNGSFTGAGNIVLSGTLNQAGGQVGGTGVFNIVPGAILNVNMSGGGISRLLNNSGRINVGIPTFGSSVLSAGTVTNNADGVIAIGPNVNLSFASTRPLNNLGTVLVNAGTGTAMIAGAGGFTNRGKLIAEGGTLTLSSTTHVNGGMISGSAPIVLADTSQQITANINSNLAGENMILRGTLSGDDESFLSGTLHWVSGNIQQVFPATTLILPGGVLNAIGSSSRALSRSIVNEGVVNISSATISWNAGSIINSPTGVINISASSTSGTFIPPVGAAFINQGMLTLTSIGSLAFGDVSSQASPGAIINSGTILSGGAASSGAGGTLTLGAMNHSGSSWIGGLGIIRLSSGSISGTLTLDGNISTANFFELTGPGSILVRDRFTFSGGRLRNTGGIHIVADAVSNVSGGELYTSLTNSGVTNLTGMLWHGTATATFNNLPAGIVNLSGGSFSGGGSLSNAGVINSFATTVIQPSFDNTGTLAVQFGTTSITGLIAQLSGTSLTAGNWLVGPIGQLNLAGASITTNSANVELVSSFAEFPALNSLANNQGTFSLRLGRSFTAAGSLTNSGVINIDNGGALFVNDALFNSGTINGLVIQTGSSTLSGNSYIKTLRGGDVFVETSAAARVDYLDAAALSIASSTDLTLGAGSIAHVIDVLNIAPADGTLSAGRLDLLSGRLVIDYTSSSPADVVSQLLATGFNNGDWLGRGITSSSILTGSNFAIGMIESAELFSMGGTFAGVNVDNTALLLDRTLKGDANLDYTVNISDFAIVAANFNTSTKWSKGDFNYDNITNIADFALLAANFNQSLPIDLPRQSIPEPAMIAVAGLFLCARKRTSPCGS